MEKIINSENIGWIVEAIMAGITLLAVLVTVFQHHIYSWFWKPNRKASWLLGI